MSFGKRSVVNPHPTPVKGKKTKGSARILILGIGGTVALAALVVFGLNAYRQHSESLAADEAAKAALESAANELARIRRTREAYMDSVQRQVAGMMKDPDSARFSEVVLKDKSLAVCGKVNARNGYGGYGAEKKFVAADGMIYILDDKNSTGVSAYSEYCMD